MWHYDKLSNVQIDLLDRKIIDLQGKVDEKMIFYIREAITRLIAYDSPDITIHITSDGGRVDVGLDIYDFLQNYSELLSYFKLEDIRSNYKLVWNLC